MAETDNVVDLMQAQLKRDTDVVRDMARGLGVNYAIWPHVRDQMTEHVIDRVEIAEFLLRGNIRESWVMMGVKRYRVESDDPDGRIESITVAIHGDTMTIEVMGLRIVR